MPEPATAGQLRRVAAASLVGTMVEWYDFYVYGVAAAQPTAMARPMPR